ncbi:MAG: HEPN domain-containing protein [Isosphaeraceae bacterium]
MGVPRQDLASDWLLKVSHDLTTAHVLARRQPRFSHAAAFHCHQAAEKALKGFLVFWGEDPTDSYDVGFLLHGAERIEPCFDTWRDAADRLTPFVAYFEDPPAFELSDAEQVDEALDDAECIRRQVLSYLFDHHGGVMTT